MRKVKTYWEVRYYEQTKVMEDYDFQTHQHIEHFDDEIAARVFCISKVTEKGFQETVDLIECELHEEQIKVYDRLFVTKLLTDEMIERPMEAPPNLVPQPFSKIEQDNPCTSWLEEPEGSQTILAVHTNLDDEIPF